MRYLKAFFLVVVSTLFLIGCLCYQDNDFRNTRTTDPRKVSIQITSVDEAFPKMLDQDVADFQPIGENRVLILGNFASVSPDCYLRIVDKNGIDPFQLNSELFKLGRPVAMSNIVDNKIAIAIVKLDEARRRPDVRIALIDLKRLIVEHRSDALAFDQTGCFNSAGDAIENCANLLADQNEWEYVLYANMPGSIRLTLLEEDRVAISATVQSSYQLFTYNFRKSKLNQVELVPFVTDARPFYGQAAVMTTVRSEKHIVAVVNQVNQSEFEIMRNRLGVRFLDKHRFEEKKTPLVYKIDTDTGELLSVQPIKINDDRRLVINNIVEMQDGFVLAGNLSDGANKRKGVLLKMRRNDDTYLELEWSKHLDLSSGTDEIKAILVLQEGRLAIAGNSGFVQVPTGSVVKAGDCFVAVFDIDGEMLNIERFGSKGMDSVVGLKVLNGDISVLSIENMFLTHDPKVEPFVAELRKVKILH